MADFGTHEKTGLFSIIKRRICVISLLFVLFSRARILFLNGKEAKRGKLFIGVRPRLQLGETSNNLYHIWEPRGEKLLVVVFRFIVNGTGYRLHPVSLYLFICLFAFLWTSTAQHKIASKPLSM